MYARHKQQVIKTFRKCSVCWKI